LYKEIYHTKSEFIPSQNLPLSWTNNPGGDKISTIKISKNCIWLNGGSFKNIENFTTLIDNFSNNKNIVIRGCNRLVVKKLKEKGFSETLFAKEAIIELNKDILITDKLLKRINSLLKRGRIKEIFNSEENNIHFNMFLKLTVHQDMPKLKNLFLDKLSENTRLFIYEINQNQWEGAILISKNSESKMQGEQFFRKKAGMNGVMDALVFQMLKILRNEGYSEFSLGEVPFIATNKAARFSKANLLSFIGKRFQFAYNYQGLHYFKDKFATRWDDIYICTNRKLKFYDLFIMAKKSNLIALAIYKIFN
jgi:glycosyltransferase 2 family protein